MDLEPDTASLAGDGLVRRLPGESRGQSVANALRRDIVGGLFTPGQRLTEDQLSHRYAVSRVPVREALRVMQSEGFVRLTPYTGILVASPDPEEATDLFAVREVVEGLTAGRAAVRRTPSDAAALLGILDSGLAAQRLGQTDKLPALNTALHLQIATISGSEAMTALWRQLSAKIEWLYAADVDSRAGGSWREHTDIVQAIAAGDEQGARQQMREHVAHSRKSYLLRRTG